ncbi:TATA-binding protein-associated factor 172 [Puma concolor]|uniref:TATA-binding protein-associated factor 172 n=1 Tax=Puma concolor TaxID=9696 RepID=A0A6P6HE99_PUMCO|nr:TATA-binding protein-associated factor 172 [Puma concolor]
MKLEEDDIKETVGQYLNLKEKLDRLFILLDTGTTPVTRKAAAQQLGEVVKLHPHELNNLLSKVLIYLRSTNWDTRIAAGQAVEAIVKNVPEWNPIPRTRQESTSESAMEDSPATDRLNFDRFDICRLLQHGASLLGSAGAEFEVQDEKSGEVDPKERIARQRKLLQKKLGLNMGEAIGMSTEELFNDEDLDYTPTSTALINKQPTLQAAELIDSEFRAGMSSRQKNKAKRMAKLFAKQRSRDAVETNEKSNDSTDGEPEEKRRKIANVVINQSTNDSKVLIDNIPDSSSLLEETNEWPLESFCEELCNDLFNPSWEVRHGAGTGLREILKAHGKSGGKMGDSTLEEMIQQHQEWLEDLVIRLLCVFALDRFGDFVSDEVVAPVRETCAQTLGVVLKHMNETGVHKTVDVLLKLLTQEQWEVRHGGLLGIKYALAVRQDVINTLLPKVLTRIIEGLQDFDDDVRAVAAASLVPVVESLVDLQTQKVPFIINTLWDALLELDDLTASTNSIMTLLSSLLTYPQVQQCSIQQSLTVLVPRVWPFLHHTISSVRRAALETLFTLLSTQDQVTTVFNEVTSSFDLNPQVLQQLDSKRQQVQMTVTETNQEWQVLQLRVHTFAACAVVSLQQLPEKLNPIIKPLMETIKKEENTLVQNYAAQCIAKLLQQCTTRTPCPNSKIIKNLCSSLCVDPYLTPCVTCPVPTQSGQDNSKGSNSEKDGMHHTVTKHRGIITLYRHQKAAFAITSRRGPTPKAVKAQIADLPAGSSGNILVELDEAQKPYLVQRRGAEFALTTIVKHFGGEMAVKLPHLWDAMVGPLRNTININNFDGKSLLEKGDGPAQELVNSLQVFETAAASMDSELHPLLVQHLPHLYMCLQYPSTAVRHMAARCVGIMSKIATMETMNIFLEKVLPWLGAIDDNIKQEGAIEALACVMEQLDVGIVPYIVLLVVPVLGRMSDQTDSVRFMATQCFATLIRLMPLEAGIPDPPNMSEELIQLKAKERHFLEQLLDGKKLENYKIPVPINAELRKYQQDGVNWLAFLNKYKLHGILCDDMGLGKTLQSICILAGDHCHRAQEYARSKLAECMPLPSLVVCPPTLTGHWVDEVGKFCSKEYLNPLHYTGPPTERIRLQHQVKRHNLIVASYDVVRNDIDFFRNIKFNYCILDEGHVIKNGKTKLSKAVKQLTANYRIILSGTPIQNNVLELWSLFDFLMPGFLGTERQFAARYGKPILASRDARSSSREQEAGVLAMDALHRQVLPFLLRRMKEDVLQDLPPKIIQDYYCTLSPLQVQLYEDFAKSRAKCDVDETVSSAALSEETEKPKLKATGHVFQALQYLRKLCNHPALVLTPQHPEFKSTTEKLAIQNSSLHDIQHAPKLSALKQLLLDCGLGNGSTSESGTESVVAQHRILIFCQLKSMLDIVEHDLLKPHLPSVTYLRLDGSIPPGQRHSIVSRFNNDPSIDVLLLTTHVGGLGLNLTGADTVVFVEHDWNPMRDLQAMDRAHRIGQKRVVNVYRLITRGTLEEKIMGLQKFKMNIANTVISQENSSLQSMGTDQLLDLFTLDKDGKAEKADTSTSGKASMKSVLENLSDLWDQEQYDSEYSLENFMHSLK